MPPEGTGDARDGASFKQRLDEHLAAVLEIYDRVIHAQKPLYDSPGSAAGAGGRSRNRPRR
jgi:hypothetical protein